MTVFTHNRVFCPRLDAALAHQAEIVADYRRAAMPESEESQRRARGNHAAGPQTEEGDGEVKANTRGCVPRGRPGSAPGALGEEVGE